MVAITLAPFLLLLVVTGSSLFFRKSELYDKEVKEFLVSLHTWEIIAPYVGLFLGVGLLFLIVSGTILFFKRSAWKYF